MTVDLDQIADDEIGEGGSPADDFLDELFPEELDWRRMVCNYPRVALLAAAAVGFLVGQRRGLGLVSGFLEAVTQRVGDSVEEILGATFDDGE